MSYPSVATPCTVLVLDGRRERRRALQAIVEREGHRVLVAGDTERARQLALAERPEVLIAAQSLLDGRGVEILAQMEAVDPGTAVVLCCRSVPAEERARLVRDLGLHGLYDEDDGPASLLSLVDTAIAAARRWRRARSRQELRELIVAKLCHELRTCLHVIRGYSEILLADESGLQILDVSGRIGEASEVALGLVRDYLDLARLEWHGAVVRHEPVDVDALVDELSGWAERAIGGRAVRLRTAVPARGIVVYTDGEKLRAILRQLLANAIKFTPSGEVELAVRLTRDAVEFDVADGGPGADAALAFAPFGAGGDDSLTSTPGQGLGLAIAGRLGEILGASLGMTRHASGGSVFTLRHPVEGGLAAGAGEDVQAGRGARPILH